ncbi:MAG: fatty acid desaturase [Nitratireductor sp.]
MAPYKAAYNGRATLEVILTIVPLVICWVLMWYALQYHLALGLLMALPTGGFLIRLFAIQHDCGHGAMFSSNAANDWVGRVLGAFTFTPYDYWKHSHALHHASSGNLDKRGFGDITTHTIEEYKALSQTQRILYRLYRNPIVMFLIGPAYVFFFKQRLPFEMLNRGWTPWLSTLSTNVGIAIIFAVGIYLVGVKDFLIIQLSTVFVAAAMGIWLFYVQHQFEDTHWERKEVWKREYAALMGSSYYALPKPIMWLTANIGIHHVHHLSAQVPFYRLPEILKEYPDLKTIGRLSFWQSLKCVPLTLWDENSKRMISFRELGKMPTAAAIEPAE